MHIIRALLCFVVVVLYSLGLFHKSCAITAVSVKEFLTAIIKYLTRNTLT